METVKNDTAGRELTLTRVLDTPIDLVWEVITQPQHLAQWWGTRWFHYNHQQNGRKTRRRMEPCASWA